MREECVPRLNISFCQRCYITQLITVCCTISLFKCKCSYYILFQQSGDAEKQEKPKDEYAEDSSDEEVRFSLLLPNGNLSFDNHQLESKLDNKNNDANHFIKIFSLFNPLSLPPQKRMAVISLVFYISSTSSHSV